MSGGTVYEQRYVDLDEYGVDCRDDAIITLQMLVVMHDEPHRKWKLTREGGSGAWNYTKA